MNIGGWKARRSGKELSFSKELCIESYEKGVLTIRLLQQNTDWKEWIKTVGEVFYLENGDIEISYDDKLYHVNVESNGTEIIFTVNIGSNTKSDIYFMSALKTVMRKTAYCIGCRVCEANCPNGFISMSNGTVCVPIHPYTALLLKHISSAFDSNQRSMFDFIKNDRGDEIKGFQWFIDNYGPENENPLLTIDMLWEFFYDKGRDMLAHDIRSVLDYFTRSSNQRLDPEEKRILKTVLLLQAISQHAGDSVELFIPNEKNVDSAFEGTDLDGGASRIAERLVRDKVLFHKQLGGGKFQYAAYVNEVSDR